MAEWVKKVRATTTLLRRDRKKTKNINFTTFYFGLEKLISSL